MQVDEFGREIPAVFRRPDSPPPPPPSHHATHQGPPPPVLSSRSTHRDPYLPSVSNPPKSHRKAHPSTRYVDRPLLCEFVWKDQKKQDGDDSEEAYEDYRRKYCLNYVRSFFNKHLDDSWFRAKYSPAAKKHCKEQERERAAAEAKAVSEAIQASLDSVVAGGDADATPSFVVQARLGQGHKEKSSAPQPLHSRKRRYSEEDTETNRSNTVPASHVLHLHTNPEQKYLTISEVPPHVNEDQILAALMDHCHMKDVKISDVRLFSSTPTLYTNSVHLQRQIFCVAASAVVDDIVTHLAQQGNEMSRPHRHVPRKDHEEAAKMWELDVDCRDPYGRLDYDHDGKGGAPEDGLAVPPRKSTVLVSNRILPRVTQTLSAAVSSKERIPRDQEAAKTIARALDVACQIPEGLRLDDVLDRLALEQPEDVLDVSVAYLRRVHLFSFYNGCTQAECVGDVLAGKHAASTIHLRLENADSLLKDDEVPAPAMSTTDETSNGESIPAASKDLLVQRLDDSIAKALEDCSTWINAHGSAVDEITEEAAAAIVEEEQKTRIDWLQNHSLDDDGRARCSFHFCHKLFKDDSFLHKHLLKKHREYLVAEQAKTHDKYMMRAWDEEPNRAVPDVQVDCGLKFGLQPSPVLGREPTCEDPEPLLWQQEEARRNREAALRQQRQQHAPHRPLPTMDRNSIDGDGSAFGGTGKPRPSSGFVDVDDMKETKVEMVFENVDVVASVASKKKKKKRKLL